MKKFYFVGTSPYKFRSRTPSPPGDLYLTSNVQNIILFSQGFNGPDGEIGPKGDKGQKVSVIDVTFRLKIVCWRFDNISSRLFSEPKFTLEPFLVVPHRFGFCVVKTVIQTLSGCKKKNL